MQRTARVLILALGILGIVAPTWAHTDMVFDVKAEIKYDGKLVGQPMLRVRNGNEAQITVSGNNAYRFSILINPQGAEKVHVKMKFSSASASAEPEFVALIGKEVSFTAGDTEFRITVSPPQPKDSG